MATEKLDSLVSRLEIVTEKLERVGTRTGSRGDDAEFLPPFEEIINKSVSKFVQLSESIGKDVEHSAKLLQQGFLVSLEILKVVSTSKKPGESEIQGILRPLSEKILEIKSFADKNFKSEFRPHLDAVAGVCVGLGWFPATMKPQSVVKEAIDSGIFYSNRVLTSFKDKGPVHKEWVQSLTQCFKDLQQYLEDYHSTGCCWNPSGKQAVAPVSAPSIPKAPAITPKSNTDSAPAPSMGGVFAEINKGVGITSGLKKVDDSMKTHKNPNLRAGSTVADKSPGSSSTVKPKTSATVEKAPVFELQGKKWLIENQKNQQMLSIDEGDIGVSVFICACNKTNAKLATKMNTVSIVGCTDCKFQLCSGLIGSCEIINCKKVEIHADDVIPFITVNNTESCQVYLNQKSISSKVSTAKSSSVNVCVWDETGDLKEHPVPYQFISQIVGGKLITSPAEDI